MSTRQQTRPARGRLALPRRRRRITVLAAGLALIAAGGLCGAIAGSGHGRQVAVLALARTVDYGHRVTASDLKVAHLGSVDGLAAIPATDTGQVSGRYATTTLHAGSVLTAGDLTTQAAPAKGEELVGVQVKPGQLPGRPPAPGSVVQIVDTPGTDGASSDAQTGDAPAGGPGDGSSGVSARVVDVGPVAQDGSRTVDVVVAAGGGPALAAHAATGHVAIVYEPGQG